MIGAGRIISAAIRLRRSGKHFARGAKTASRRGNKAKPGSRAYRGGLAAGRAKSWTKRKATNPKIGGGIFVGGSLLGGYAGVQEARKRGVSSSIGFAFGAPGAWAAQQLKKRRKR